MKTIHFILFISFVMTSCHVMKQRIKHNHRKSNSFVEKIYKKYHNVFYAGSMYSNFSYVWTYKNDSVIIGYTLVDGKIKSTKTYKPFASIKFPENNENKEIFESECLVMDGDFLSFKILRDKKEYRETYYVKLPCFVEKEWKSNFLNYLKESCIRYCSKKDLDMFERP